MLAHEQYKEQWRQYVLRFSKPEGLSEECLTIYDRETTDANASWSYEDFAKIANDALSDWDI